MKTFEDFKSAVELDSSYMNVHTGTVASGADWVECSGLADEDFSGLTKVSFNEYGEWVKA